MVAYQWQNKSIQAKFERQNAVVARSATQHRDHPERDLQNSIIDLLSKKGHFVWKMVNRGFQLPSGGWMHSAVVGVPDILGVQKGTGKLIGVEVKMKGRKPTQEQVAFLDRIRELGGIGLVAYSIDDVMDV